MNAEDKIGKTFYEQINTKDAKVRIWIETVFAHHRESHYSTKHTFHEPNKLIGFVCKTTEGNKDGRDGSIERVNCKHNHTKSEYAALNL